MRAAEPNPARLADYAADYYCPELDVLIPVTLQDGALFARIRPGPALPSEPTFARRFLAWPRVARHVWARCRGND